MKEYRFERASDVVAGPVEMAALDADDRAQILEAAKGTGSEYASVEALCAAKADELDEDPDMITVELWDVFLADSDESEYRVVYFPWLDGGELVRGARSAGVRLSPDGFRPVEKGSAPDDLDLDQLSVAWDVREQ